MLRYLFQRPMETLPIIHILNIFPSIAVCTSTRWYSRIRHSELRLALIAKFSAELVRDPSTKRLRSTLNVIFYGC